MSAQPPLPKPALRRGLPGFTLIEIMLVVVIIGVLSSLAIPYFQRVTARSRRAEALIVLDKIHVYFVGQFESSSTGTFNTPEVVGMLGGAGISQVNPNPATATGQGALWITSRIGWQQIPFSFDGGLKLRYSYAITTATRPGDTLTITVVGEMPGLGADFVPGPPSGNYLFTEVLTGTPGGGVFINVPTEIPAM